MAQEEKGLVFTGCRARLMIGLDIIGFATGVTGRESIQKDRLKVIGNIRTKEHVPVDYDVSFTMQQARIVNDTLKKRGYFPKVGVSADEHLANILASDELSIFIQDIKTGAQIAAIEQASLTGRSFSIQPVGIVFEDLEGVAIIMRDESET